MPCAQVYPNAPHTSAGLSVSGQGSGQPPSPLQAIVVARVLTHSAPPHKWVVQSLFVTHCAASWGVLWVGTCDLSLTRVDLGLRCTD